MTEEIKKLIESVKTFNASDDSVDYILDRTGEFVLRYDFDRVVEELTKWNKVTDCLPGIYDPVLLKDEYGMEDYGKRIHGSGNNIWASSSGEIGEVIEWKYIY
jgi:hypothetical protein